jgi:streptogramin lyase
LILHTDGKLYVASWATDAVLRYDGATGAFLDVVVPAGSGGLDGPSGLAFDAGGNLFVASALTGQVLRYGPASQAVFTVSLSPARGVPVTVEYATVDDTAAVVSDVPSAGWIRRLASSPTPAPATRRRQTPDCRCPRPASGRLGRAGSSTPARRTRPE